MQLDIEEMESISILTFLKSFSDACGMFGICKVVATWLVSYFMKKPASFSMEARRLPGNIRATAQHDARFSSYIKVLN